MEKLNAKHFSFEEKRVWLFIYTYTYRCVWYKKLSGKKRGRDCIKPRCILNINLFPSEMYERTCVLIFILIFTILPSYINCNMWPKKDHYNTRWDKMNLDRILENKRLLRYYFNCLMSKGPCPPDGQVLKSKLKHNVKL